MKTMNKDKEKEIASERWQSVFTWMLLVNVVYIIGFYIIMKYFN